MASLIYSKACLLYQRHQGIPSISATVSQHAPGSPLSVLHQGHPLSSSIFLILARPITYQLMFPPSSSSPIFCLFERNGHVRNTLSLCMLVALQSVLVSSCTKYHRFPTLGPVTTLLSMCAQQVSRQEPKGKRSCIHNVFCGIYKSL